MQNLKHLIGLAPGPTLYNLDTESRFRFTAMLVEATSYEKSALWARYAQISPDSTVPPRYQLDWRSEYSSGVSIELAHEGSRPICVSLFWVLIDGKLACFWDPTSLLVDYAVINPWLETTFPGLRSVDANNFTNAVLAAESTPTLVERVAAAAG